MSTKKPWEPKPDDRVCSLHFKNGARSIDYPDPCVNLGYKPDVKLRHAPKQRSANRVPLKKLEKKAKEDSPISVWDHSAYIFQCTCVKGCTCSGCLEKDKQLKKLTEENERLRSLLELQSKTDVADENSNYSLYKTFIESDTNVKSYTGLKCKDAFDDMYKYLAPRAEKIKYWVGSKKTTTRKRRFRGSPRKSGPKRKVDLREEFLCTLMKLRLGVSSILLSDLMGVSESVVSSIFNTWIKFLAVELRPLIVWPTREQIQSQIPHCLKHMKNLRCTIDCTEVFITRPRDREIQALTWSDYKKHNTVKFLVGISPNGTVTYISKVWGGRASDRHITLQDGFIDLVEPYDLILADRGFTIKEDLVKKLATLEIPPSSSGLEQMSTCDVKKTKRVANARIHVERAIGRMKLFAILQNTLPVSLVPLIDDIVTVCAALVNLLPPLVQ